MLQVASVLFFSNLRLLNIGMSRTLYNTFNEPNYLFMCILLQGNGNEIFTSGI